MIGRVPHPVKCGYRPVGSNYRLGAHINFFTDWWAHINFFKMTDLCNEQYSIFVQIIGGGGARGAPPARPPVPPPIPTALGYHGNQMKIVNHFFNKHHFLMLLFLNLLVNFNHT